MILKIKRIIRKLKSFLPVMKGIGNVSFSQFGEDVIMLKMLERCKVHQITYLDIGANEPVSSSNTYSFYLRGYSGVLVEPNADLCNWLRSSRPRDKVLNFGIGSNIQTEADYYMFGEKHTALNTFSEDDALNTEKEGIPIKRTIKLPLKDVNDVIADNFSDTPTILSLDVEGLDEQILRKLDLNKHPPLLICVETVVFSMNGEMKKRNTIIDYLTANGYFVYADTHVNTIFCHKDKYSRLL